MAASTTVQGENVHSTATRTPTNIMPSVAGHVCRCARHHVSRIGNSDANATIIETSRVLMMKYAPTVATIHGTDSTRVSAIDGSRWLHAKPVIAAVSVR